MKTAFRKSFERDLKNLKKNRQLLKRIQQKIEYVEKGKDVQQLAGLKKLTGGENYYRMRIGDYRIGVVREDDTIVFVRCLHRRDIYRYFP